MESIPSEALAATWYKYGDDGVVELKAVRQPRDLAPGEVSLSVPTVRIALVIIPVSHQTPLLRSLSLGSLEFAK